LLGGCLTVKLPVEISTPKMSARTILSTIEDSRVEWNDGRGTMYLVAHELFARAGNDLEEIVRKQTSELPMKVAVESATLAAPLHGYIYYPIDPLIDKPKNFVMGLYVAQEGKTVQRLTISADKSAAQDFTNARGVAASVFSTLAPGNAALNDSPGQRLMFRQPSGAAISITVPGGYVAIEASFTGVRKLVRFGQGDVRIGLQLRNDPPAEGLYRKRPRSPLFWASRSNGVRKRSRQQLTRRGV
jgi:hypothetical protein